MKSEEEIRERIEDAQRVYERRREDEHFSGSDVTTPRDWMEALEWVVDDE